MLLLYLLSRCPWSSLTGCRGGVEDPRHYGLDLELDFGAWEFVLEKKTAIIEFLAEFNASVTIFIPLQYLSLRRVNYRKFSLKL